MNWPRFKHHDVQQEMIQDHLKFIKYQVKGELCPNDICPRVVNAVAGRGSGKTDIWRKLLVTELKYKKPWPDPIFIYAMPTYGQAERVAWEPIQKLIPEEWILKNGVNIQKQTIKTIFGSTLYVAGLDKSHRIEGLQIDGIVIDESSDIKPGIFDKSIRPMLSHRHAWVARIGVPKRSGIGRAEYKGSFDRGLGYPEDLDGEPIRVKSYHWVSETIIPDEALKEAKSEMTLEDYNEQYRAEWIETGGGIYYSFSVENVSDTVFYDPARPLLIGCDFNVNPMAWVVCQEFQNKLHVINEIFLKNTNTEKTLQHLRDLYPDHDEFLFYGDASSRARKTSAAKTDYLQIKTSTLFQSVKVFFPRRNPALVDRWTTTNTRLCDANGKRSIYIHPRCKRLIKDLKEIAYKENTEDGNREREDYRGTELGHMCDSFDYIIYKRYPLHVQQNVAPVVLVTG